MTVKWVAIKRPQFETNLKDRARNDVLQGGVVQPVLSIAQWTMEETTQFEIWQTMPF